MGVEARSPVYGHPIRIATILHLVHNHAHVSKPTPTCSDTPWPAMAKAMKIRSHQYIIYNLPNGSHRFPIRLSWVSLTSTGKTHHNANTPSAGFQGFHPPRPGEDEDLLTESNIRQGYQCAQAVPVSTLPSHYHLKTVLILDQAEAFTSKTLVIATLTGADGKQGDPITELGDFMNEIFKRRQENLPQIP